MKQEIEHTQHVIEKDRLQLLKDFDEWWERQSEQAVCNTILCTVSSDACFFHRNNNVNY